MDIVTIGIVFFVVHVAYGAVEPSPEKLLIDSLLANYSRSARPVRDPSTAINVNLTFIPFSLDEIDEKLQTMTVKGILRMQWRDEFLTWDTQEHFGMERIILDRNLVWRPDIVIYNGVGSINAPVQTEENKIIVNQDGAVEWDAEGTFIVSCPVDMERFPFDEQHCWINISNNKYTLREVHPTLLNNGNTEVSPNGQWWIHDLHIYSEYDRNVYKYMGVVFHVKRRPAFYVMNMVMPSLLLTMLGNCLYLIPPGTSDRVAVGTTLVLAYTVFMIQVTENTPGSFAIVPYITIFLLVAMAMSAVAVMVSILVLRLSKSTHTPHDLANLSGKERKEAEYEAQLKARYTRRVDIAFFCFHLAVYICLVCSVIIMAVISSETHA